MHVELKMSAPFECGALHCASSAAHRAIVHTLGSDSFCGGWLIPGPQATWSTSHSAAAAVPYQLASREVRGLPGGTCVVLLHRAGGGSCRDDVHYDHHHEFVACSAHLDEVASHSLNGCRLRLVYIAGRRSEVVTCRGDAEWPSKATGAVVAAEVRAEMVFTLAHSNGRSPRAAGPWQSDRLTARRYSTEFMSQKTNPIRVDYLESGYTHSQPAYTITTTPKMAGCTLEAQTLA